MSTEERVNQIESFPVDAVFVIGTGSRNKNEELRYALRNLEKNCPFIRNVYISGECPGWINKTNVIHLQWPDRFKHAKDANIIDKLRHACEEPGIAKKILFCSDDQFQTRECTWEDFQPRWLRRYSEKDTWYENRKRIWHSRLKKTLERDRQRRLKAGLDCSTIAYWQPHIWMPIDRDLFIEYAKWSDYPHRDDTIIASGYYNFINADGKSNFDHIFISSNQRWPVKEAHVAYTDGSYNAAMNYLKSAFPELSRFEKGGKDNKIGNLDSAIDHLAVAVAYLSSSNAEAKSFEYELAKGEVQAAMTHLLALNKTEEYNRCRELIGSSNGNLFTVEEVKKVLRRTVESRGTSAEG